MIEIDLSQNIGTFSPWARHKLNLIMFACKVVLKKVELLCKDWTQVTLKSDPVPSNEFWIFEKKKQKVQVNETK